MGILDPNGALMLSVLVQTVFTVFEQKKCSIFTTSKTDCQILRQKVNQRISGMKTNNGVFVVFKTKHELECLFS